MPLILCSRHIPEALNEFNPDVIAYNAGELKAAIPDQVLFSVNSNRQANI